MSLVQNFKNITWKAENVPTPSTENVYTCPTAPDAKTSILIGCDIANLTNSGVSVTVAIYDASKAEAFNIVQNAPIAVGSSLQVINKQKHILEEGDILQVTPDQGNQSVGLVGACMEISLS